MSPSTSADGEEDPANDPSAFEPRLQIESKLDEIPFRRSALSVSFVDEAIEARMLGNELEPEVLLWL